MSVVPSDPGSLNQNPSGMGLWALLREDLAVHDGKIFEQGFWAMAVHRFGNWRMGVKSKALRAPLSIIYKAAFKVVEWTCGISLPYTVKVGRRVRLWHHGGMILNATSIGNDVTIRQNTTFGVVRTNFNFETPVIDDGADIGVGACILGAIRIGRNAVVGANAVVLDDVPDNAVAVGVPAKVVKYRSERSPAAASQEACIS